jgi:hypothetical protein
MTNFPTFFHFLLVVLPPILFIVILVVLPFTSKRPTEFIVSIILLLLMIFYFSGKIRLILQNFYTDGVRNENIASWLSNILAKYQRFFWERLPRSWNRSYIADSIPLYILSASVLLRWGISKYVKHKKLQYITREYWLFITTYLIFIIILSQITGWSFILLLVGSIICLFVVIAGLFRLLGDGLHGATNTFGILKRMLKIIVKELVLLGTMFVSFLRNLLKFIRELYNRFILEPCRRFLFSVHRNLDKIEHHVDDSLDKLKDE